MLKGLVAALLLAAATAYAAPADLPGWGEARWGMTAEALRQTFGDRLERLPGRWQYGDAFAEWMMPDARIAGLSFVAYFQMGARDGRLRQVLLQAGSPTPAAFDALTEELTQDYGTPRYRCVVPLDRRDPLRVEDIWVFPTTTVHATFLDFRTDSVVSADPNIDRDPLQPDYQRRRNRDLPRRVLLRFHATSDRNLMPDLGDCRQPSPAQR